LDRSIEERFQCLIDSLSEACFGIDDQWRYIFFNTTAELLAGMKREEVLGQDIRVVFPDIVSSSILQEYEYVMKNKTPRRVVGRLTLPDGRKGRFAIQISPIPEGIFCLVQELDERAQILKELKESEAFLMALLNAPHDYAILVTDPASRIAFANDAARTMFGYSRKELAGKNVMLLIPEETWSKLAEISKKNIDEEISYEVELPRKHGPVFPASLSTYTLYNRLKALTARITFVKDLTGQKEIEARRLQATRFKAIAELTKDVAHNFNNLLGSIMGCAQMLKISADAPTYDAAKLSRLLDQILNSGSRMTELVQNMLAFTGMLDPIPSTPKLAENLDTSIREAISLVQPALDQCMSEKGIKIGVTYTPFNCPRLNYLTENIRAVIIQVLLNAVEAMDRDGQITLSGQWPAKTPDGEEMVLLEIRDTGRGMDKETLERAVDPLFSTKKTVGVGVGLTLAFGIIRRLDGNLTIESAPEKGTTVRIWLPVNHHSSIYK